MTIRPTEPTASRSERRRFTLNDLFQDTSPRAEGVTDLDAAKEIRLDRIVPDPEQPRRTMDRTRFEELVASVRQEGVLVPIEVSYDAGRNIYIIVHGERRWRAANEAGLATIPALVREVSGQQRIVHQLMENILREDLNAVDRARALRTLKDAMGGAAWEHVADAVGIRRSRLFQLLDVIKLPDELQEDIRAGRLSEKHGRAFKDLTAPQQAELRELVIEQRLSGDETLKVAQTLRRSPDELTVKEAFTVTRTPPPLAGTGSEETAGLRAGLADEAGAGPALQGGESSSAAASESPAPAEAHATPQVAGQPASAATAVGRPLIKAFPDIHLSPPSPLELFQHYHTVMLQLLPEMTSAPMQVGEMRQAITLLEELQDLIDVTLDGFLRDISMAPDQKPSGG